jgi:hypothetical protein
MAMMVADSWPIGSVLGIEPIEAEKYLSQNSLKMPNSRIEYARGQ